MDRSPPRHPSTAPAPRVNKHPISPVIVAYCRVLLWVCGARTRACRVHDRV